MEGCRPTLKTHPWKCKKRRAKMKNLTINLEVERSVLFPSSVGGHAGVRSPVAAVSSEDGERGAVWADPERHHHQSPNPPPADSPCFSRGFLPERAAAAGAIDGVPVLQPADGGGGGASGVTHQLGAFVQQDARLTRELRPGDAGWD